MTLLGLLVAVLATFRVTRLVTTDKVFDRPRTVLWDWLADRGWWWPLDLLGCDWCVSVWIAAGVTVAGWRCGVVGGGWRLLPVWLAVAGGAGLVAAATSE